MGLLAALAISELLKLSLHRSKDRDNALEQTKKMKS